MEKQKKGSEKKDYKLATTTKCIQTIYRLIE